MSVNDYKIPREQVAQLDDQIARLEADIRRGPSMDEMRASGEVKTTADIEPFVQRWRRARRTEQQSLEDQRRQAVGVKDHYPEGAAVMPYYARGPLLEIDMHGAGYNDAIVQRGLKEARAQGMTGVRFNNMRDGGYMGAGRVQNVTAILDPKENAFSRFPISSEAANNSSAPRLVTDRAAAARSSASAPLGRSQASPAEGASAGERVVYRGLNRPYDPADGGNYQTFTSSEADAHEYGSHVMAARLNRGRNLAINGGGNNFNSLSTAQLPADVRANLHPSVGAAATTDEIAHAARKAGYDSVTINNVHDNRWGERPSANVPTRTIDIVFDTKNITPIPDFVPTRPEQAATGKVRLSDADRALLAELEDGAPPSTPNGGPSAGGREARRLGDNEPEGIFGAPASNIPPVGRSSGVRGMRAAVRDPETGRIYAGANHAEALDNALEEGGEAVYERALKAASADDNARGFVTPEGQFITREEGLVRLGRAARTSGERSTSPSATIKGQPELNRTATGTSEQPTTAARLSPDQSYILKRVGEGASTAEIAAEMRTTPNTVRVQISHARKKLASSGSDGPASRRSGRPPGWGAATIEQLTSRRAEILAQNASAGPRRQVTNISRHIADELGLAEDTVRSRLWAFDKAAKGSATTSDAATPDVAKDTYKNILGIQEEPARPSMRSKSDPDLAALAPLILSPALIAALQAYANPNGQQQ